MPTISQFYEAALVRQRDFPSERTGQALMNTLYEYNEPLWRRVIEEEGVDPFYDDSPLDDFYNFIDDNWDQGMTIEEAYDWCSIHHNAGNTEHIEALIESGAFDDWYSVSTDDAGGIVAYFANEKDAFAYRLYLISIKLNGPPSGVTK